MDFKYAHGEDYTNFITVRGVISILNAAIEFVRQRGQEEEPIYSLDALKASFDLFFKGMLVPEMFEFY